MSSRSSLEISVMFCILVWVVGVHCTCMLFVTIYISSMTAREHDRLLAHVPKLKSPITCRQLSMVTLSSVRHSLHFWGGRSSWSRAAFTKALTCLSKYG